MSTHVTALATRSGGWWAVHVPGVEGLFTQARRLEQIPDLVTDAAELLGVTDIEVAVVPEIDAPIVASAVAKREAADALAVTSAVTRCPP